MLLLLFIFLLDSEILLTEFAEELGPDAIIFNVILARIDLCRVIVSMNVLGFRLNVVRRVQVNFICVPLERVIHDVFVIASRIVSV